MRDADSTVKKGHLPPYSSRGRRARPKVIMRKNLDWKAERYKGKNRIAFCKKNKEAHGGSTLSLEDVWVGQKAKD